MTTTPEVTETPEDEVIVPFPSVLTLTTGQKVTVVELKTRQLIRLTRILTHGMGSRILDSGLNPDEDGFEAKLIGLLVTSIPEAEDDVIEFIGSMIEPVGLRKGRNLNRADKTHNDELWTSAAEALDNPDLDDLITLVEAIVKIVVPNLKSLGKRVTSLMPMLVGTPDN